MSGYVQGSDPRRNAKPWKPGGLPSPAQGGQGAPSVVDASGAVVPSAPPGLPQRINLYLPNERPIPGATLFNISGQQTTTLAQNNVLIPGAALELPTNALARIDNLTLFVQALQPTSQLTFDLLFNSRPVPGFTQLSIFPGLAALFVDPYDIFLDVPKNTLIQVRFTNTDGGSYLMGASFSGWFWAEAAGRAWIQNGQSY